MADVKSAIIFHSETYGPGAVGDCHFRNVGCVLRTIMRSGASRTIVIPKLELGTGKWGPWTFEYRRLACATALRNGWLS